MHYNGPVVRPYTDAGSVMLEVTVGCTHNSCTFCNFYEGVPFRIAPMEQIEEDLQEVRSYNPNVRNVWAAGGNPYALPVEKLAEIAKLIRKYLPEARISTYARVDDLLRKSVDDMKYLKELGIEDLVIGIESAYDPALSFVNKGYTAQDILTGCKRLEEAGVDYRLIYLGGIAGSGNGKKAAHATAEVLNQLHPYYLFMSTVALLPGTKLHRQIESGEFQEESEKERIEEFRTLLSELDNQIVVDSRSVANAIPFVAELPRDKERVVAELDDLIAKLDKRAARQMHDHRARLMSV